MRKREAVWFYITIAPWLLGFLIFTLGPILASIYFSLTSWDLFTPPKFVGIENYTGLLTKDKIIYKAIYNTLYYSLISVPLNMALSLGIAYLLNKPLRGMRFFRTVFYVPSQVPIVAASMLFIWLFAPDAGLINQFLALFGIDGPAWLLDPQWVKPALIIQSTWGIGTAIVLLLAGMQGIPPEFYEAAEMDGASSGRQFFHITLPLLTPIIFFNLVMAIIGSLQTFSQVFIMTNGGPNNASTMIVPYLFDNAFRFYKMGYASSIAWVLFLLILLFTLFILRSSSIWVFYESEVKNR
jgi:multiple sugar transport system permease protein